MAIFQPIAFGDLLRRFRIERGLTQEQLAERARLSPNAVAALESGARKTPRRATLDALSKGLALSTHERAQFEAAAHPSPLTLSGAPYTEAEATRSAPFVGRAAELVKIERFLAPSSEGALVCALAGEPGIGKSRLLYEAVLVARAQGWTVLDGGCYRQDGEAPSSPWPRVLMRFLTRRSPAQQRLDLQGCAWLARLLPELADSGVTPLPTWNLASDQERRLIYGAVGRLLTNIAGPAGTVLALDDLQWAGADALVLLAALVRERAARPLKILLAYRDTELADDTMLAMLLADLAREGSMEHIALHPLRAAEARELLERLLPQGEKDDARGDALRDDVLRRADGVPFFLVSCAADLRSRDLGQDAGSWFPPQDVAGSVRQRLVVLPSATQEVLKIAAIAGRVAPVTLLFATGAAAGMDETRMLAALEEGRRSGLLVEVDGERYAFAHDLIHEVIVADLSAARRRLLHRRVADALAPLAATTQKPVASELAWHLGAAGETARALPYTLQAADEAARINSPARAEWLYRQAVDLAQATADEKAEARAREQLGALLYLAGRFDEAVAALGTAIALYQSLGARDELAIATQRLSRTYNNAGMVEEGAETLRRTIVFLTPADDEVFAQGAEGLASLRTERALASVSPAAAARLGLTVSKHLLDLGRPQRGFEMIEQTERYAHLASDSYTVSHAHSFRAAMLAGMGRVSEALETWREAVEMTRQADNLDMLVSTLVMLSQAQIWRGELHEAKRCAQEAFEITTTQLGDASYLIDSQLILGEVAFIHGQWQAARECFQAALASAVGGDVQFASEHRLVSLARLDIAEGKVEAGLRILRQEAVAEGYERLSNVGTLYAYEQLPRALALAEYELFFGDFDSAARRLARMRNTPDAQFTSLPGLLAQARLLQGQLDEAKAALDEAITYQRAEGLRLALIDSLGAKALLALQLRHWDDTDQALAEALNLARTISAPYAEVKLLELSGRIAMERQRFEEAREEFMRALETCDRLGERLYHEHIQRALSTLDETT
jgi:tetratricopeptide (TPR) repeat protein/transcriptional regulator with XRE-family HTH domain